MGRLSGQKRRLLVRERRTGAYRYDGKSIVRFTPKHGLSGDRVREFREDKAGNIFIGTLTGIIKFDGKALVALRPVESKDWRLDPDDLWFKGDSMVDGPYRYDGKTLHHLEFPKSALEDEHRRRNPKPPASPYGVYTIHQDSKGTSGSGRSRSASATTTGSPSAGCTNAS